MMAMMIMWIMIVKLVIVQDEGAFIENGDMTNETLHCRCLHFPEKVKSLVKTAMSLLLTNFCKMTWLTFLILISSRALSYEKMNEAEPVVV